MMQKRRPKWEAVIQRGSPSHLEEIILISTLHVSIPTLQRWLGRHSGRYNVLLKALPILQD